MDKRILVSYTTFSFKETYWNLNENKRKELLSAFCESIKETADKTSFYQVFPARHEYDFMVWTTIEAEKLEVADEFFKASGKALNPYRKYIESKLILCGITKPSIYSKARKSPQELDPYKEERKPYFVIYPFSKTPEWYMKSREERQAMMNGHIKLGKQYPTITQLLLYSFGIQDQEFIVAYEMDDLYLFSDLVQALRSTEARLFTLLDTPIITGTYRTQEELIDVFANDVVKEVSEV